MSLKRGTRTLQRGDLLSTDQDYTLNWTFHYHTR